MLQPPNQLLLIPHIHHRVAHRRIHTTDVGDRGAHQMGRQTRDVVAEALHFWCAPHLERWGST